MSAFFPDIIDNSDSDTRLVREGPVQVDMSERPIYSGLAGPYHIRLRYQGIEAIVSPLVPKDRNDGCSLIRLF